MFRGGDQAKVTTCLTSSSSNKKCPQRDAENWSLQSNMRKENRAVFLTTTRASLLGLLLVGGGEGGINRQYFLSPRAGKLPCYYGVVPGGITIPQRAKIHTTTGDEVDPLSLQ